MHIFNPESRSMIRSSGTIEVLNESIHYLCPDYVSESNGQKNLELSCEVKVAYKIQSLKEYKGLTLTFVSPDATKMEILYKNSKNKDFPFVYKNKKELPPDLSDLEKMNDKKFQKVFETNFSGNILSGEGEIEVKYVQKISFLEKGYGYFSKGYWVYHLTYYTWPLKEWNLNPDFYIDFTFEIQKGNSGSIISFFQKKMNLACTASSFGGELNEQNQEYQIIRKFRKKSSKDLEESKSIDLMEGQKEFEKDYILNRKIKDFLPDVLNCSYYK